jgi:DNA-binding transcriptional LysR family regulator
MAFDGRLLSGVSTLAAVVESGSFVKAADALGLSASGISRAISRLEARVGVRLLDRTTRSLRLTDEGTRFYQQVVPHLDGIEEAATLASGASRTVRGRLRVNVDPFFSRMVLAPRLHDFVARYPELELELQTRGRMGDLVADGVNVAVRFGVQPASSQVARKLAETRVLTVASPAYLAGRGTPKRPADIADHACIHFRNPLSGRPFEWELHKGNKVVSLDAKGPLLMTDPSTLLAACLGGAGIAQVLGIGIQDLIAQGRLVELYPDWPGETFPLYAVRPSRHNAPAKVDAFIDFCTQIIKER